MVIEYASPFEPPKVNQPLRFRYTSYMGEYHPAEKKVVVEFSPKDFGLTEDQQLKLKKLAGPRYNPEKETIKMSCESFEHQAQNKRHLAELVEKLVAEARVRIQPPFESFGEKDSLLTPELQNTEDLFKDIPLDLRHHPIKIKPKFPKEWRMSTERSKQIEDYRQETKLLEAAKKANGTFIDGKEVIKKAYDAQARVLIPINATGRGKNPQRNARF